MLVTATFESTSRNLQKCRPDLRSTPVLWKSVTRLPLRCRLQTFLAITVVALFQCDVQPLQPARRYYGKSPLIWKDCMCRTCMELTSSLGGGRGYNEVQHVCIHTMHKNVGFAKMRRWFDDTSNGLQYSNASALLHVCPGVCGELDR